jgi:hypothetical protein
MRIVPKVLFGSVVVGVVPALVVTACGDSGPSYTCTGPGCDQQMGVAQQCFGPNQGPGCAGVALQCFDGSTDPSCTNFGVAQNTFGDGGDADAPDDAGDADATDAADVGMG